MKIQTQLNKIADEISLSGNNLIINGDNYDLDNVQELPENESPENQRVYLSGEDTIIFLKIDVKRQFMFINGNDLKFYDVDCNGILDVNELKTIVDHWNMSEAERRTAHKLILNK